jgi:ferredoxin
VLFKRCLRAFDGEGRFAPVFDEADTTLVPCDTVLMAIGQTLDLSFIDSDRDGLELTERGMLACDGESGATAHPGVFVAGDAAYGPKLLIHAVASGKRVARSVHARLTGEEVSPERVGLHLVLEGYQRERDYEKLARTRLPAAPVAERLRGQAVQVEQGLDESAARREAARCLDCGVNPVFDGQRCVLCGGCVDVCPESCLKIVSFSRLEPSSALERLRRAVFGAADEDVSAILKDEEACIRCALCAERCPNGAITMERYCFKAVTP